MGEARLAQAGGKAVGVFLGVGRAGLAGEGEVVVVLGGAGAGGWGGVGEHWRHQQKEPEHWRII